MRKDDSFLNILFPFTSTMNIPILWTISAKSGRWAPKILKSAFDGIVFVQYRKTEYLLS